ncbi:acyl-CoA thioesterase [Rhodobacter calidifons]|uniref:Acyl-CoA thioesterase n=1 Tax=Rhodobacter calidifons TaxID=2715277 RepID=A0ABX0G3Z7_9RHOB|nr:thioesterase family protein [Rhodobacter calidifons]NHB75613.1 acyl-CoA thioesterase [Rhodobacter calidifons]
MTYARSIRVEFNHCDPAGIVFYPRYFEMMNSVIENFFRDVAGCTFGQMTASRTGVPTVAIETVFHAPSRLDDMLDWHLSVTRLGRSSAGLALRAHGAGELRLSASLTLVHVNETGRPRSWPQDLRDRIAAFQETT